MNDVDKMAIDAISDSQLMDKLIKEHDFFILRCASEFTGKYISKKDDEWSIALYAFSYAVKNYTQEKGSFLSFARLVIERRLIDYCRTQSKHRSEISVDPTNFDCEPVEDDENLAIKTEIAQKVAVESNDWLKLEIEAANQTFETYGFSFYDLIDCSPKAEKTKNSCKQAVLYVMGNPILLSDLKASKLLPIKIIEKNTKVPRKILERHRKYIIAAIEIISGDYPYLAEYMRFIREELGN